MRLRRQRVRLKAKQHDAIPFNVLLSQPRLMDAYFANQREWLETLDDPLSQQAAGYGMVYTVLADQMIRHPDWLLLYHEALCEDPHGVFRRLFSALDVPYTRQVDRYLDQSTSQNDGKLYGLNRVSKNEPDKWKSELSTPQIDRIAEVVSRFRLPFYRDFA